ncbi:hypothetical protein [Mycoplasmopsis pulmonis]|uniref:hypothetical protein n=1 Tax=Mycoplasmopsis pulmonis TaxID=2107 RepID=UPI00215D1845|nr:hypothetical protein [Mycoplasmopsis pulmonis]MDZ7293711.1 hypothetical protein [Mycoplasmopsis pulmonis]
MVIREYRILNSIIVFSLNISIGGKTNNIEIIQIQKANKFIHLKQLIILLIFNWIFKSLMLGIKNAFIKFI